MITYLGTSMIGDNITVADGLQAILPFLCHHHQGTLLSCRCSVGEYLLNMTLEGAIRTTKRKESEQLEALSVQRGRSYTSCSVSFQNTSSMYLFSILSGTQVKFMLLKTLQLMLSKKHRHTSKHKLPLLVKFDQNRPSLRKNINDDQQSQVSNGTCQRTVPLQFQRSVPSHCPNTHVKEISGLSPELLLLYTRSQKAFGSSWEVSASIANVLSPLILRICCDAEPYSFRGYLPDSLPVLDSCAC